MEQRYGLGLSIDQGFADQARQERIAATQTADQLQASNPGFGLQSVLPSLKGAFASAGAVGSQQAKATLDLSQMQRQLETSEFVSKLAKEAVDNQFITQEEAASFDALGRTDAAKALEALSKTANGRRVDLAATNFVNQAVVPRIQQLQAKRDQLMAQIAKEQSEAKANPEKLRAFRADDGGQGIDPRLAELNRELEKLAPELFGAIDSSMSQTLPEARELAKKKTAEYLSTLSTSKAPGAGKERNVWAEVKEAELKNVQLNRLAKSKDQLVQQLSRDDKALNAARKTLQNMNSAVDDLNRATAEDRSVALHPATFYAMLTGQTLPAVVNGKAVTPAQRALSQKVMQSVNQYMKDMSGAQVTVGEAGRLFTALGLPIPASLGADAGKVTVLNEVQKVFADAMAKELQNPKSEVWRPGTIQSGLNNLIDSAGDAVIQGNYIASGRVGPALFEQHRSELARTLALYPEEAAYLRTFGNSYAGLLGMPEAKRIGGVKDIEGTVIKRDDIINEGVGAVKEVLQGAPITEDVRDESGIVPNTIQINNKKWGE